MARLAPRSRLVLVSLARVIEKTETATSVTFDNSDVVVLTSDGYLSMRRANGTLYVPTHDEAMELLDVFNVRPICIAELTNGWKVI